MEQGADGDVEVKVAAGGEIADGAGVDATGAFFMTVNGLHGALFRAAGDGTTGENGAEEVDGGYFRFSCGVNDGDEVEDILVGFEFDKCVDVDATGEADFAEIIAHEVSDHQ